MPRCARQWELVLCRGGCCMGASEAIGRCDAGGEHTSIHPDIPWAPALWQNVGRAVETVSDSPGCWGLGVEVAAVLRASHWAVDMPVRLQGPRSLTLISTLAGQASASHPAEEETGSEGLTRQRPGKLAPRADSVTLRGAVLLLSSLPRPARLRCAARTAVGPGSPFSKDSWWQLRCLCGKLSLGSQTAPKATFCACAEIGVPLRRHSIGLGGAGRDAQRPLTLLP